MPALRAGRSPRDRSSDAGAASTGTRDLGCAADPLGLATIHYHQNGWPLAEQTFRQVIEEVPNDPALRAHGEQELAFAQVVAGDLPGAVHWANVSLRSAEQAADPHLVAHSLARVAAFEFFQGHGVRLDLLETAEMLGASTGDEQPGRLPLFGPALIKGLVLKWCDRLDEARLTLADQYRRAPRI